LPDNIEQAVEGSAFNAAKTLSGGAALISQLVANSKLGAGNANSLQKKIDAAQQQLGVNNVTPAVNQLQALLNELNAMIASGRVTTDAAAALQSMVNGVITSVSN
jgi:hypothetical protein